MPRVSRSETERKGSSLLDNAYITGPYRAGFVRVKEGAPGDNEAEDSEQGYLCCRTLLTASSEPEPAPDILSNTCLP